MQRLQPQVALATSTTAATVEPTSTRRCAEATTPGVGDATTVGRIGAPRPNHSSRIAKWVVEIMGETISFAPRKAIKSQVLADFVAEWVDT
jgi:hypothetical protein